MEQTESVAPQSTTPHLHRLADFEAALQDYHLSPDAQQTLDSIRLTILVGPSSSGRNTIINRLVATGRYHFVISDTTRPPRVNNGVLETEGVEYWFRTEDDMLADIQAGKFLEAEVIHQQQVSGVSIRELEKSRNEHRVAITDLDIGGISNVIRLKPDTAAILILPPSFDEWQRRLKQRGRMSDAEWRRRIETALRIFSAPHRHGEDVFKVVVNDDLEAAVQCVDTIATTGTFDPELQQKGLRLANELYTATKSLL